MSKIKELFMKGELHDYIVVHCNTQELTTRLNKAWGDAELIVGINQFDMAVFIMGIESKSIKFMEEVFVKVDEEGLPEALIGDTTELIQYVKVNKFKYIGFGEIDPDVLKFVYDF